MDRNQPNTTYRHDLLNPLEKCVCFLRGLYDGGPKNVNVSNNFYLRSWSYCQALEIALKKLLIDDKITACLKQICLRGVIWKVSNRKTLSGETFCFLEKCLLSIFKFDALNNLLFFFRPPDWSLTNFLGMYCCFPVIQ